MSVCLTLMAKGEYQEHLVKHFDYDEAMYFNFEEGDEVITSIASKTTNRTAEAMCKALNIQLKNLRTHGRIDTTKIKKATLIKAGFSEEEMHSLFSLRKSGYEFFAILDM